MKIKIISFLLLSLSFMVKAQTSLMNDSLKGFNEKELQHHLETFKGTEKEKQEHIARVKRRYINRKYNLGSLPPSNNFRNTGNQPGTQATCTNIDFESGNTSGWTVTGDNAITSGAGLDPFGGFPVVHPGGNFSLQLSNNNLATSNFSSSATRVISVSAGNTFFNLHFAMDILDFPHDQASAATLTIQFFNSSGTLLPCPQFLCEYYLDGAGNPQAVGVSNFQQTAGSPGVNLGGQTYPVTYAPWQTVAMDLTSFVGTNITCVVTCKWCIYDYDWAYCYIDADCPTSNVVPPGTCISLPASLCGPPGMGSYNWTAPAGNSVPTANTTCISATTAGVYTLDCSSIGTCSTTPYTYTYTVGPGPTASFTNTTASCAGTVNFTSTSATNGGPAISSYTWDWGDGTPNGSGSTTPHSFATVGTQTVTLLVTNGTCIDSIKGTVVIPPHPIVNFTTVNNCLNSVSTFTSTSTATSGIASQIWNFGDASANGSGVTPGHTYASAGTYTVTLIVTDNSPCTDSIKLPITINPLPNITVNAPSFCSGTNTTINAGGASTYAWNPGTGLSATTGASVTANPASTTSYTIIGTDANSCVNSNTTTVTVIPNPTVSVNNPTICIGGSVTLNANGATTYMWSPATGLSTTTGSNVIANPTATTTYTITGTNITCSAVATTVLTVNPLPIITVSSGTICINQQTATLTAGGASTYNWAPATGLSSASGTSVTANPTVTTNYLITGTDVNGCVNTNTTSVTVNPLPIVTVTGNTVCANATINLTSSNGGVSYLWSGPNAYSSASQNPGIINATVNMSGSYSVTVTDANGCINGNVAPVTVNPLPIITVSSGTICITQQTATLTAGGANIYNWSPATGLSSASGTSVSANPTVTTNYLITGTDVNGCVNTNSTSVTVNPLPLITVNSGTICINQQTATLTAGGANTYNWSPATGISSTIGVSVTANPTVTTNYLIVGTDGNGCVNTNTTSVTVNPLPVVSVTGSTVCVNATISLTSAGGVFYSWSGPNAYSSNQQNPNIVGATTNLSGSYAVTVTDANGCINGNVTHVTVNPFPNVTVSSTAICNGNSGTLNAAGANTYAWNPTAGLSSANSPSVTATVNTTTFYTVTGTDINGCVNTAVSTVTVNPLPVLAITPQTTSGCAPLCVSFLNTTTATGSCLWAFGDGKTSTSCTPNHCFTGQGTFGASLTLTDNNGCVNSANASVIVYPVPIADFNASPQPTTILDPTIHFVDATVGAVISTYSWTFGDPGNDSSILQNPIFIYQAVGSYPVHLTVTSNFGCKDSILKIIKIDDDFMIYVPNAFSPNADGTNDMFFAKGEGVKDFKLYVFDRWGSQVFFSDDIYKGWDGRFQSKGTEIVQEDIYVWKIECKTSKGEAKLLKGVVSLIK